ncbi:MAG: RNA pseudouridine synthase [Rikenellaceae bacterium]|nr:RNA pseudouridine synthase [Rikenellaceae bacterium]
MSFKIADILYEDNHLLVVNKKAGQLVQADTSGDLALEDEIKAFIKVRDNKPGNVFLGVVHRIDRPVSGVILFAKSKKALVRMNEMMKKRELEKHYWAITENRPAELEALLVHQLMRDGKTNKSFVVATPRGDSKEARLRYKVLNISDRYTLLDVELMTGRHHQIRCQLSKIGCPIRGDLKYGAKRSMPDGSISLHSRSLTFTHPVRNESMTIVAPVPKDDNLWKYFDQNTK